MPKRKINKSEFDIWQSLLDTLGLDSFWKLEELIEVDHGYIYTCRYRKSFPQSAFYKLLVGTGIDSDTLIGLYNKFAESKGIPYMQK